MRATQCLTCGAAVELNRSASSPSAKAHRNAQGQPCQTHGIVHVVDQQAAAARLRAGQQLRFTRHKEIA